jgi:transglutaminase-like putative cysteine protease
MVDREHPEVQRFAREHAHGADDSARAVALYLAVRDGLRYDPYRIDVSMRGLKASTALAQGCGRCVPKAVLLAAACRAAGIPARVGYADVRTRHGVNPISKRRGHRTGGGGQRDLVATMRPQNVPGYAPPSSKMFWPVR